MHKVISCEYLLMKLSGVICLVFILSTNALYATIPSGDNKWKFIVEPYVMFPSISGVTGIRDLPDIELDANAGDIFSHLQIGGMVFLEARNDRWAITSDLFFANLEQEAKPGTIVVSGKESARQFEWEMAGFYRLAPFLELGVGGRLNNIESDIDLVRNDLQNEEKSQSASLSNTWIDPIIIARISTDIGEKWNLEFRSDLGGFNIGSRLTWQLQGFAGYRLSELFQIYAGYRINSINYDKGTGDDRFRYDVRMFGPIIKFRFNF